jgi:predicted pyridoxine 5'-phosphate oxidase superfamily flavin-nucleotide-binding protein
MAALSLLLALGSAERSGRPAIDCTLAAQLLAEVSRLPVAERRLALRLMYGRT